MPLLQSTHLSDQERAHIKRYFSKPQRYIDAAYHHHFGRNLPGGLKLTRLQNIAGSNLYTRFFIFPGEDTLRIGLKSLIKGDCGMHSCELIDHKMYFHQNREDLAIDIPVYEDDGSFSHYDTNRHYLKMPLHSLDGTAKWVVNNDNFAYILKSTPLGPAPNMTLDHCLPSLYVVSYIRNGKRIDIMHPQGENLNQYLARHSLNSHEKDVLAQTLIAALQTLHEAGIVHTDINANNICIKIIERGYQITIIDDSEAYRGENTQRGRGTPGYLAPELFKTPPSITDYASLERFIHWQEAITDNRTLFDHFVADKEHYFSQDADRFSLGCVLLRDLGLTHRSAYFDQAMQLCQQEPSQRILTSRLEMSRS